MTYDNDDEIELDVESHRLRRPEEMRRMSRDGGAMREPDWDRRSIRPILGAKVAVYGYRQLRVAETVIRLLGGVVFKQECCIRRPVGCRTVFLEASVTSVLTLYGQHFVLFRSFFFLLFLFFFPFHFLSLLLCLVYLFCALHFSSASRFLLLPSRLRLSCRQ